ncbi:hypothetical protein M0R72_04340 [Candidatus Pacearchaeota archaeon]|jgi:hypothetical protein|nr:hypothetical protein [Candidatus Pacearchaeota archaeon]
MELPFQQMFNVGSGTELIYSFVIMLCSLMVFFGTKQIYELSSHKGIKYFRIAFLLFAAAYFFRYFIKFFLIFFNVSSIHDLSFWLLDPTGKLTTFAFMYLSSISVFYLLYSVMWKKWGNNKKIYLVHVAAILISLISIMSRDGTYLLFVNLFLFVIVSIIFYIAHKNSKKKKHTFYFVYMLLVFFWFLNILDVLIPSFFQGVQLIIYLCSISIFLTILYRVIKRAGD